MAFGAGISATAHDFVVVVLGGGWADAAPLMEVLALAAGAVGLRKAIRVDPALAFAGPGS